MTSSKRPKSDLSPAQRVLRSRIGGKSCAAKHTPDEMLAPARAALASKFEREVDPDGVLDIEERTRRAAAAKAAFYQRLSLKGSQARREKAKGRKS